MVIAIDLDGCVYDTEEYYRTRPCARMIHDAAAVLDVELARRQSNKGETPT